MNDPIRGKVALILGAAGGIGSACARALAARGALLTLVDIDDDKVAAVRESLVSTAERVSSGYVDITEFDQVAATVDAVLGEFGRLDVLINCVGVMYIRPLLEVNVAEWDTTIDLNLKGAMWSVAAALPTFLHQGFGHFISLGSVHGVKVSSGGAVHSASKFGVNAFNEGLSEELAQCGVRVTTVNPGAVDTGMQYKTTGTEQDRLREIYAHAMPAEIVARAVEFAIEQPPEVTINEIVLRPTSQQIWSRCHNVL